MRRNHETPQQQGLDTIRIVDTQEQHIEGAHRCLDVVARERRHLALLEAPPLDATRAFIQSLLTGGGIHVVAVDANETVVGWCDIVRDLRVGYRHSGRLGMGLLHEYRGKGLGAKLASAAIERGWDSGLERIELDVFASNARAIALYQKLGFVWEGVKRKARMLDDSYDDMVFMALVRS